MGVIVGNLIGEGSFPKCDLDIPSSTLSQSIITWAKEFENKYQGPDFDYSAGILELGNPEGYLDAIDHFTEVKLREMGWLTETYINDENRFWHGMEFEVDVEYLVTQTIRVPAFSAENARSEADNWWNNVSVANATKDAENIAEFYIRDVFPAENA
ncbi:hypothetical protein ASD24_29505 [Paenibacillus sp. Root52]|uniref:hypothetical protein n=1 Tax=Paenibacillus sp. Root52 TaxID=1736552 RepID=UPI0006F96C21|nr:hypothetical protein [Paenibacillus sp. Root52]KQY83746.1 hypothetical protein ASD24_29505 [Paenibacillus sp. Root52]